ncbi:Ig-like domain-containing protein, partial [Myxococcota bacterium]|nr:Ig-like domain-containing protein [Myxococcota bacterium]
MFGALACAGEIGGTTDVEDRDPPAAPEGFVVVGEDGGVVLGWGFPAGTMQKGVHVYWGTDPSALTEYFFVPSPRTRYQLGGLVNGQTYAFALTMEHATGALSERTTTKLVVPRPLDLEPPRLVAADPDPSIASLAPDAPITFELSETMALATVAVSVVPERALARPEWDSGGRRVTIRPSSAWQEGASYRFTIEGEDLAGNVLTTTTAVEVTTGYPTRAPVVTGFSPHDGMAAVPQAARVSVSFDEGMDVESVVRAFEVHPNPGCVTTADATGRTFTCTPSAPLVAGGAYGVLVRTTARSVAGVALAREVGITFTVAAEPTTVVPTLVSAEPADGAIGVDRHFELVLTFDVAMDRAATEAALSFPSHPGLGGVFTWASQGRALHFQPSVDPPYGAHVAWALAPSARSIGGATMTSTVSGALRVVRRERRAVEPMVELGGTLAVPTSGAGPIWV